MRDTAKPADALTADDLKRHPVWRFVNDDSIDETTVRRNECHTAIDALEQTTSVCREIDRL